MIEIVVRLTKRVYDNVDHTGRTGVVVSMGLCERSYWRTHKETSAGRDQFYCVRLDDGSTHVVYDDEVEIASIQQREKVAH